MPACVQEPAILMPTCQHAHGTVPVPLMTHIRSLRLRKQALHLGAREARHDGNSGLIYLAGSASVQICCSLYIDCLAKIGQFSCCHALAQQELHEWFEYARACSTDRDLLTVVHEREACRPP